MNGDVTLILTIGSLVVGVLGTAFGFWRFFVTMSAASEARMRVEVEKVYALIEVRSSEYNGRLAEIRNHVASFELDVAKRYVTADNLQRMEADIRAGMEKVINRLDLIAADFNRSLGRMERHNSEPAGA